MTYTSRPCSPDSDYPRMLALANAHPTEHLHVTDLPYRFSSWALDEPENARLWFDSAGELAGWAVLQSPFWTFDITCRPELYPAVLAWADQRARALAGTPYARPCWFANVFSGQAGRRAALEQAGFACQSDVGEDSWSKVLLRRVGQAPLKVYTPPAGYTVRPLAGESEVEAYTALHQAVFESKNMTAPWRARSLRQPAHRPELDLVVAAPDGRLAAFCIGWLNENGRDAHIEPLGCHKDFRRFALGRVALAHTLERLRALDVEQIFVETDNYRNTAFLLYRSFDFEVIQDVLVYRKDYPE